MITRFGSSPIFGLPETAFAMLAGLLTPYFDSPLRRRAEEYPNLTAYTARMMREFYPEHRWEAVGY